MYAYAEYIYLSNSIALYGVPNVVWPSTHFIQSITFEVHLQVVLNIEIKFC